MASEPTIPELVREAIENRLLDLHTALPGRIESYDAAKQTAEVKPLVKRAAPKSDGGVVLEDLPVCPNVPVCWPGGGGYAIHLPLAAGDTVWLIFSEGATGQVRETGEVSPPGDLRRHSLGYAFAIPARFVSSEVIDDAPSSEAVMVVGAGGSFRVSEAGMGSAAQPVVTADALLTVLGAAVTAAVAAGVPMDGGKAAFGAFGNSLSSAGKGAISSSKLKAQVP
jgi:hypothetical protein